MADVVAIEHALAHAIGHTRRDPGDLVNMIMGDFLLLETAISHQVPQMVGGLVLPVIAFVGLCFWNPPMAIAMFVSLPAGALVLLLSTRLQNRLSQKHMRAKIDAGNRIQEYINRRQGVGDGHFHICWTT